MKTRLLGIPGRFPVLRTSHALVIFLLFGVQTAAANDFSFDIFSAPASPNAPVFSDWGNQTTTFTYDFIVTTPITVDGLGAYSASFTNPNGQPEDVALYSDSSQTALVDGWVTDNDPEVNGYNWIAVSPLLLDPGDYALSVYENGNSIYGSSVPPLTTSGVTWVNEYYSDSTSGGNYTVYNVTGSNNNDVDDNGSKPASNYGSNLSVTPEPSPLLLIGTGLLALAFVVRTQHRKVSPGKTLTPGQSPIH